MKDRSSLFETRRKLGFRSFIIFSFLIAVYLFSIVMIALTAVGIGLFIKGNGHVSGSVILYLLMGCLTVAVVFAAFHYFDSRRSASAFILDRVKAVFPDSNDQYHVKFTNTVEEMRISAGIPRVECRVFSSAAINSFAVMHPDGTPVIAVSEGAIAECTRDEIQALVAHELAHLISGDLLFVTTVCGISKGFEKILGSMTREKTTYDFHGNSRVEMQSSFLPIHVYLAVAVSTLILRLLSMLISRQRELVADSQAVILTRNPEALASVIYKASIKNSFIGNFLSTYTPIFIVSPATTNDSDGFFDRIFNTHPSPKKRIDLLATTAGKTPELIIEEVRNNRFQREQSRTVDDSSNRMNPLDLFGDLSDTLMLRVKSKASRNLSKSDHVCPRCQISLKEKFYEGVLVKFCPDCKGYLVPFDMVYRIFWRKEYKFSDKLLDKALAFEKKCLKNPTVMRKVSVTKDAGLKCPQCSHIMVSVPYSYQYLVPVERCRFCKTIWFDSDELEILQILIEKNTSELYSS